MKQPYALLAILLLCASCSSTNLMSLSVTVPAPVTLPPNVKSAAVVDRTRAADENKTIDAIHKALSLESKNLQMEGARASVTGLTDQLRQNNRFVQVKSLDNLDLRSYGAGVFPVAMPWDSVEKICRQNNADVLFSLELFDAGSKVNLAATPARVATALGAITAIDQQVSVNTQVRTGWRIYDPASRNILDEEVLARNLTFQSHGLDPFSASSALIGHKEEVKQAGINAGQAFAMRIVPYSIRVSRFYYVRANPGFIIARRMAQTGNWDGAAKIWMQETNNPSRKVAGRACYNMAIISEINGDLDGAIQWAQKAYEMYNIRLALSYVNVLHERQNENAVLKSQTEVTSNP